MTGAHGRSDGESGELALSGRVQGTAKLKTKSLFKLKIKLKNNFFAFKKFQITEKKLNPINYCDFLKFIIYALTESGDRAVQCLGLQRLDCWDRWFECG